MRLGEHLVEFRNRLVVSIIAIVLGMVGGFLLSGQVLDLIRVPVTLLDAGRSGGASINFSNITQAFDIRLQMSLALGIVLSSPVWLYEIWMFLMPGLKKSERAYALGFVGAAIPLFLAGCFTGWTLLPRIVEVMVSFAPSEDTAFFDAKYYYTFVLQLCLAVGVAYVMPVLLVLLNFAGILAGRTILHGWRWAIVLVAVFAAVATPAADIVSMLLLMVPMLVLYFLAVGIALLNDRRRAKRLAKLEREFEPYPEERP
ncbi:twin-arginine translocase subunit TatC [Pseudoclavibacter chungangensis]|uniref:Sec-independent protein translocase protein TatC n=2 Tax=Pseudoclavibacter chungangensis TaxID=587635 RepID=A0A7J5C2A4_9MICO|nr:twin-arginine translocase subunit TatC [Pseudoclavibacter chungangensis]KAB1660220.1 twin-arginine translocase subunit TatC [Pseudoclavibacter chungangensis]